MVDAVGAIEQRLGVVNGHFGTLLDHVRDAWKKAETVAVDLAQLPGALTRVIDATEMVAAVDPQAQSPASSLENPTPGP